jgi:hypothetical protein
MAARRSFWTNVTVFAAAVTMVRGIVASGVGVFGTSKQSEFE